VIHDLQPLIARRLPRPLLGAAWLKYPGWYSQQAMKASLRGPFAAFRPLIDDLSRLETEAVHTAFAHAGLPPIAILAVTSEHTHVFRTTALGWPQDEVAQWRRGRYRAWAESTGLLIRLHLQLGGLPVVDYETSRYGPGSGNAAGVAAIIDAAESRPDEARVFDVRPRRTSTPRCESEGLVARGSIE
jgi:hypothetical protein